MMPAIVRQTFLRVSFAGYILDDVLSARGEISADGGWPRCSVFVTTKPAIGNEEDDLAVEAGAGNDDLRFTGRVRRFRPSAFPKSMEIVATGTLAYAAEWAPSEDIFFIDEFATGATDQELVAWVLDHVPGIIYDTVNIEGRGATLGYEAPESFDWRAGTSAWSYIQQIDRATLYRTYQGHNGTIHRVKMMGHPSETPDFTLTPADMLDGATGSRDTERTRNFVRVLGHDYGKGEGPVTNGSGTAQSNDFQGSGADPATRHTEQFQSDMIESGTDPDDESWDDRSGLRADQLGAEIILDVNKEFVEASIPSWRDDSHGPGLTCLVDALDRLAIGEPMWVVRYAWEVGDRGWQATYGLTGGGLPQDYTPPPV